LDLVRVFLNEKGVDENAKNLDGDTAVMWASWHLEVVHAVLNHNGADMSFKGKG
jgi:hypothetical protein